MRHSDEIIPAFRSASHRDGSLTKEAVVWLEGQADLAERAVMAESRILRARRELANERVRTLQAESRYHLEEVRSQQQLLEALTPAPPPLQPARALSTPALPEKTDPPALEQYSDEWIERMARQAVRRFGSTPNNQAEQTWADWKQELLRTLPRYVAVEVIQRAEELR